jgi:REP element-mobilizing transposase RayT
MFHHVARTEGQVLLFHDAAEARSLWDRLVRGVPGIVALCLMPDHVHLQASGDVRRSMGAALSGYARSLGRRTGPLVGRCPAPSPLVSAEKINRSERYIHLNPCRAGLVTDPLAWPFSTHRDAVGLAIPPVRRADPDPALVHAHTSSDPSVSVRGTLLPFPMGVAPSLDQVFDAVASLTRQPPQGLRVRGSARSLFVRSARVLSSASSAEIAEMAGVTPRAVQGVAVLHDEQTRLVERVAGDDRFMALWPGDVRHQPRWARYRSWS